MAKAYADRAGERVSRYVSDIGDRARPWFRGSRTDLAKRFGPVGLAIAALAGGYALARHFLGRTKREQSPDTYSVTGAKKGKKAKGKKQG